MKHVLILFASIVLISCAQTNRYGNVNDKNSSILKYQNSFIFLKINGVESKNKYNPLPFGYHIRSLSPGKYHIEFKFCYCSNGAFISTVDKVHHITLNLDSAKTYELAYKLSGDQIIFGAVETKKNEAKTTFRGYIMDDSPFIVEVSGGTYIGY